VVILENFVTFLNILAKVVNTYANALERNRFVIIDHLMHMNTRDIDIVILNASHNPNEICKKAAKKRKK